MKSDSSIGALLVQQFQAGDRTVLPELVKRWHREFCNKAYWLTKDSDLAKDIAQDCWKTIMMKTDSLKDPNSFGSWAMRIVYSKSLDALRNQQRKRHELEQFAKDQVEIEEDISDHSELHKKLFNQINQLPKQQQTVLRLFYVEEYSLKEIGEILNISVGTVKSRLFHAREKLKTTIKK